MSAWVDVLCEDPTTAPRRRSDHAAAVWRDRLVVFGGADGGTLLNDLYEFDFASTRWWEVPRVWGMPSARRGHVGVVHKDQFYVFGGRDGDTFLRDFYAYHMIMRTWKPVPARSGQAPPRRAGAAAVVYNTSMYCFGGLSLSNALAAPVCVGDFHEFNFATRAWSVIHPTGLAPPARSRASLVVATNKGILFGGDGPSGKLNDVHVFDFVQRTWTTLLTHGPAPSPREGHIAVVHAHAMYVFGGRSANVATNGFHKLAMAPFQKRVWKAVASHGPPPRAHCRHAAVAYNSNLIVFGGYDETSIPNNNLSQFDLGERRESVVPTLSADLRQLVNNEAASDIILCLSAMLCGEMLESRASEIVIRDVSYPIFMLFLEYLYTDEMKTSVDVAMELLVVADRFGLDRLMRICESQIVLSLCVDNVATILLAADLHNSMLLRRHCIAFILDNFAEVAKTVGFKEMSRANVALNLELLELQFSKPASGQASVEEIIIPDSTLISDLRLLVNSEITSDIKFVVEGQPIYAHKNLCMRCDYFKTKLNGERSQELVIHGMRHAIFLSFLNFLYTDEIELSLESAREMLVVANRFGADHLKNICEHHMIASLTVDNAATILLVADLHAATQLRERCMAFMVENFSTVIKTMAFKEMSRTNLELNLELLDLF